MNKKVLAIGKFDCIIVGGTSSGIIIAERLQRAGIKTSIIEANDILAEDCIDQIHIFPDSNNTDSEKCTKILKNNYNYNIFSGMNIREIQRTNTSINYVKETPDWFIPSKLTSKSEVNRINENYKTHLNLNASIESQSSESQINKNNDRAIHSFQILSDLIKSFLANGGTVFTNTHLEKYGTAEKGKNDTVIHAKKLQSLKTFNLIAEKLILTDEKSLIQNTLIHNNTYKNRPVIITKPVRWHQNVNLKNEQITHIIHRDLFGWPFSVFSSNQIETPEALETEVKRIFPQKVDNTIWEKNHIKEAVPSNTTIPSGIKKLDDITTAIFSKTFYQGFLHADSILNECQNLFKKKYPQNAVIPEDFGITTLDSKSTILSIRKGDFNSDDIPVYVDMHIEDAPAKTSEIVLTFVHGEDKENRQSVAIPNSNSSTYTFPGTFTFKAHMDAYYKKLFSTEEGKNTDLIARLYFKDIDGKTLTVQSSTFNLFQIFNETPNFEFFKKQLIAFPNYFSIASVSKPGHLLEYDYRKDRMKNPKPKKHPDTGYIPTPLTLIRSDRIHDKGDVCVDVEIDISKITKTAYPLKSIVLFFGNESGCWEQDIAIDPNGFNSENVVLKGFIGSNHAHVVGNSFGANTSLKITVKYYSEIKDNKPLGEAFGEYECDYTLNHVN